MRQLITTPKAKDIILCALLSIWLIISSTQRIQGHQNVQAQSLDLLQTGKTLSQSLQKAHPNTLIDTLKQLPNVHASLLSPAPKMSILIHSLTLPEQLPSIISTLTSIPYEIKELHYLPQQHTLKLMAQLIQP